MAIQTSVPVPSRAWSCLQRARRTASGGWAGTWSVLTCGSVPFRTYYLTSLASSRLYGTGRCPGLHAREALLAAVGRRSCAPLSMAAFARRIDCVGSFHHLVHVFGLGRLIRFH